MKQEVILVNERDEATGVMEKIEAHRKAMLHRAFSVFIFNSKGEMLLQQRSLKKYHSGGLWTNACCSHPRPGESLMEEAASRLQDEMGFYAEIQEVFSFVYEAEFTNGLFEHEFDHVFVGVSDEKVIPNTEEVIDYCFKSIEEINFSLQTHPQKYTAWFRIAFPRIEKWAQENLTEPVRVAL